MQLATSAFDNRRELLLLKLWCRSKSMPKDFSGEKPTGSRRQVKLQVHTVINLQADLSLVCPAIAGEPQTSMFNITWPENGFYFLDLNIGNGCCMPL